MTFGLGQIGGLGGMGNPAQLAGVGDLRSILFGHGENGFLFYPTLAAYLFQDTSATTPVMADTDPVARFNDQSGKGNNATQATTTKRPLYKTNSGKPYLSFDGTDDTLQSPFVMTNGMTIAAAFRATNLNAVPVGAAAAGSTRCRIQTNAVTGALQFAWGGDGAIDPTSPSDIRNQDHVVVLTGDATSREGWMDGGQVMTGASSGAPATQPVALGASNANGTPGQYLTGNLYAALAINRRVTASEIALITRQFQGAYQ